MPIQNSDPQKHLPLSPQIFHILLTLADGEKHGYAIMRDIAESTNGRIKILPGTLYTIIKRMLTDGWIEEAIERPDPKYDDERRRYYRLSQLGQRIARLEAERLAELVQASRANGLLSGIFDPR